MTEKYITDLNKVSRKKWIGFSDEEKEDIIQSSLMFAMEKNLQNNPTYVTKVIWFKIREARRSYAIWKKQRELLAIVMPSFCEQNEGYSMDVYNAIQYLKHFSDRNLKNSMKLFFDRCFIYQESPTDVAKELNKSPNYVRTYMDLGIRKAIKTTKGKLYVDIIKNMRQGKYTV